MGAEEALDLADGLIYRTVGEHLSDLKRQVFRGAWQGQTYEEIAESLGYNESYIKEEGANLCRLLSRVLQERVTKTNFRPALERWQQETHGGGGSTGSPAETLPESSVTPKATPRSELVSPDPMFVGRERAIADLNNLVSPAAKIILIRGEGGIGKTTLARRYFKTQGFDICLELWMATETLNITPVESVVEEWLRRDFNEEPGHEFGINLERLRRRLRDQTRRIGVLIDNLEPALDGHGKFIKAHRSYIELLRVLADPSVQSVTLITSRERLTESAISVQVYPLEGLNEEAWRQYFNSHNISPKPIILDEICRAYGGNAKAMKILRGAILTDFYGDIEAYWEENESDLLFEQELNDLVNSQFDRLQKLHPEAYNLLCRLGCYRYQDVSSVSLEGVLALLWDVPERQRKQTVRALQDLSLIEARKGQYWLHPVIRVEAVSRLKASQEWEISNRKAAAFWLESIPKIETITDTLNVLEAYHHYLEIGDFDAACDVLVEPRNSKWGENIPLGWLFYRLGLVLPVIATITRIINNIKPDHRLGRLYNLLGYTYRLTGNIQKSLACHQRAEQIAEVFQLEQLKVSALLNVGLCQGNLWELNGAIAIFKVVYSLAKKTKTNYEYAIYAQCCLAFFSSCLGCKQDALDLVQVVHRELPAAKLTPWGIGYSLLFLGLTYRNLGELEKAVELCRKTFLHAEDNHFTQIKANALEALAELYREQNNPGTAISYHIKAIELLNQIGAKSDLAEAYFQLGLTYQKMDDLERSQANIQEAIRLFSEIEAPKQVEKVRQAVF